MRAVAVATVVLFHAGFGWMSGGYLGVSVFFTLSGYLITNLALAEQAECGRLSLRRFYTRRAKRLLPASMLCIAAVMVARLFGEFDRVDTLRHDALAAILQVFNWVRLGGSTSYSDLFSDATGSTVSPLEHYWSLAIEEQFYMLWPVALIGLMALARRRRRPATGSIIVVTVLFGVAAPVVAAWFGQDAAYWATPARLAEILVGASLAAWLQGRRSGAVDDESRSRRGVALLALLAVLALAATVPSGRGPAYNGLLPVFAVLSATLIWSLQRPSSVRRILSTRPLVLVGRVSYGVYLFHWPVFVLLRQHGWKLSSWSGFILAAGITAAVATASYVLVEQPIRQARWPRPRLGSVGVVGVAAVVALVVLSPAARPFLDIDDELLHAAAIQPVGSLTPLTPLTPTAATAATTATSATSAGSSGTASTNPGTTSHSSATTNAAATTPTAATTTTAAVTTTTVFDATAALPTAVPARPVRILVIGDSTSLYVAQGLAAWSLEHPAYAQSSVLWSQGCGFILDGTITSFEAAEFVQRSKELIESDLPATVEQLQPDVVVLMTTVNDVADREWSSDEGPLQPSDPAFQQRMRAAYTSLQDSLLSMAVSKVVWIVPPTPAAPMATAEFNDPVRYGVQHDIIRSVAGSGPAEVSVIDLDEWFERTGAAGDSGWRPDGVHMTPETATDLAAWYLGPEIVSRVFDQR